ncbi:hypothetical protein E2C01_041505 [Portunus trituberculatus]|uniref:Uncharacterized protein n=1 Tax=Portunus trituberculatus TaxID=210409 RepID=A0A5B7FR46_PORTR|nr:hypothetical protein [Portunus trituberculatus]
MNEGNLNNVRGRESKGEVKGEGGQVRDAVSVRHDSWWRLNEASVPGLSGPGCEAARGASESGGDSGVVRRRCPRGVTTATVWG